MSQQDVPRIAAFVPMKGHSARVPGKNIRPLHGKTLYHWIVGALLEVDLITTIVIDTDSDEIASDIEKHFPTVRVVERPEELRGDFVPMHEILVHDASLVDEDLLLQTHSTNPLLASGTITSAVEAFVADDQYDSLMSVTAWQTRFYWPDGRPVNHDPTKLLRTQDLDAMYEENSCLYLFTRDVIESTGLRTGKNPLLFPIPRAEAVDIDEEIDFFIAECMAARLQGEEA